MSTTFAPSTTTRLRISKESEITHDNIRQIGECIRVALSNLDSKCSILVEDREDAVIFTVYRMSGHKTL